MMSTTATSSGHRNVVPSEVGWQFVPQYYTFVNKSPDRLHCFYTKKSTFIHGTEGEDGKPCHGQQEIHAKITSIGFEDCKVYIHSVDAQSSADGGIIIQVIGEMSNRGEAWRKFVQTFFLAEQPNGYFVLNDIFRFLKEEVVDSSDEASEPAEPEAAPTVSVPAPELSPSPAPLPEPVPVEAPREPSPAPVAPEPVPSPIPPVVEEPPVEVAPDVPEPPAQVPTPAPEPPRQNGIHPVEAPAAVATPPPSAPTPSPEPPVQKPTTPVPPTAVAAPAAAPPAPTPAPVAAPAPARPKTWANLAATDSKKWGAAVAQESKGTTQVVPSSTAPVAAAPQTPASPAPSGPPGRGPHPMYVAAQSITTAHCFIKGVTENVSLNALNQVLARYGTTKDVDIVRSKACAFVEFTSLEQAKRAITASLPVGAGGEGGIRVNVGGDEHARITIETRKERGDRPAPRPRGGAPGPDSGRGGTIGGRGAGRGGRGGRGGK